MTPAEADLLAIATAERDRARAIAVALEQRLAQLENPSDEVIEAMARSAWNRAYRIPWNHASLTSQGQWMTDARRTLCDFRAVLEADA